MSKRIATTSCLVILSLVASVFAYSTEKERPSSIDQKTWAYVLELYEKAKAAGEQVPQDIYQWAKQDLGKIGDWEYLIADIPISDTNVVQEKLNILGADRWECIWVHPSDGKTTFIFKRPSRSYLKNIPLSQLLKLAPRGASDGE